MQDRGDRGDRGEGRVSLHLPPTIANLASCQDKNDPTHRVTPHLPTGLVGFKTTTLFFYVPATFSRFLFSEMVADAGRVRLRSLLFFPTRPIVTHPTSPPRPLQHHRRPTCNMAFAILGCP